MPTALAARIEEIECRAGINGKQIAELLNTTSETVSRWRNGKTQPHGATLDQLLGLLWLASELSELYRDSEEARLWLLTKNKLLDGDRPADRIRQGKMSDVLQIIAQMKDGAYA